MDRFSFGHRRLRQIAAFFLLSGAVVCLFPSGNPFIRFCTGHAEWVALGYLAAGLMFFFFNRTRLMFVCMGCCAAVCMYNLEIARVKIQPTPTPDKALSPIHSYGLSDTLFYEYSKKN